MQWKINKTSGSTIKYIWAFVQSQSIKKTQIVTWVDGEPSYVFKNIKKIYGDRLRKDFADNKFTLKIRNAKYNDSGNYSMEVQSDPFEMKIDVATVHVHGMFFSYC